MDNSTQGQKYFLVLVPNTKTIQKIYFNQSSETSQNLEASVDSNLEK